MKERKAIRYRLGERIRALRTERRLSQEELGELAGLHYTYIGAVERGEKNCSIETLDKIAEGLQMSIADLVTFADSRPDITRLRQFVISEVNESSAEVLGLVADLMKGVTAIKGRRKTGKKRTG